MKCSLSQEKVVVLTNARFISPCTIGTNMNIHGSIAIDQRSDYAIDDLNAFRKLQHAVGSGTKFNEWSC